MPTHNQHVPGGHEPEEIDRGLGYERSDVKITGILVFIVALGIFVVVTAFLCYGIGKVLNARMNKEDGPNNRWTKTVDIRQLGNLPSNPAMQNKIAEIRMWPTSTRAKTFCSATTAGSTSQKARCEFQSSAPSRSSPSADFRLRPPSRLSR